MVVFAVLDGVGLVVTDPGTLVCLLVVTGKIVCGPRWYAGMKNG